MSQRRSMVKFVSQLVAISVLAASCGAEPPVAQPTSTSSPTTTSTVPSTTTTTTTSTTMATTTTSTTMATTTTSTLPPCPELPDITGTGFPQVTVTPECGPVGTLVRFEGDAFGEPLFDANGDSAGFVYGLSSEQVYEGCELFIHLDNVVFEWFDDGHVAGSFVIGAEGGCFQGSPTPDDLPTVPGTYILSLNCHVCIAGAFAVTED